MNSISGKCLATVLWGTVLVAVLVSCKHESEEPHLDPAVLESEQNEITPVVAESDITNLITSMLRYNIEDAHIRSEADGVVISAEIRDAADILLRDVHVREQLMKLLIETDGPHMDEAGVQ